MKLSFRRIALLSTRATIFSRFGYRYQEQQSAAQDEDNTERALTMIGRHRLQLVSGSKKKLNHGGTFAIQTFPFDGASKQASKRG